MTADTVIERRVRAAAHPSELLVVTSDLGVQRTCSAAGADVMGCPQFLEWIADRAAMLRTQVRGTGNKRRGPTLGDYFPGDGKPKR